LSAWLQPNINTGSQVEKLTSGPTFRPRVAVETTVGYLSFQETTERNLRQLVKIRVPRNRAGMTGGL